MGKVVIHLCHSTYPWPDLAHANQCFPSEPLLSRVWNSTSWGTLLTDIQPVLRTKAVPCQLHPGHCSVSFPTVHVVASGLNEPFGSVKLIPTQQYLLTFPSLSLEFSCERFLSQFWVSSVLCCTGMNDWYITYLKMKMRYYILNDSLCSPAYADHSIILLYIELSQKQISLHF